MHPKIQTYVANFEALFGLDEYRFDSYSVYRQITAKQETSYILNLIWFPRSVDQISLEEGNPPGTCVVEVEFETGALKSIIFVGGVSFARGPYMDVEALRRNDTQPIVQFMNEIGKTTQAHPHQQQRTPLHKIKHLSSDSLLLQACINEIDILGVSIQIKWDQSCKLVMFSCYGDIPTQDEILVEDFTLTLSKINQLIAEQVNLIALPVGQSMNKLMGKQREQAQHNHRQVYGIEEIWIRNHNEGAVTYPFLFENETTERLLLNLSLTWTEQQIKPLPSTSPLSFEHEVTIEQALNKEKHPDLQPIIKEEEQVCIAEITALCSALYPQQSGEWYLSSLRRKNNYLEGIVLKEKNGDASIPISISYGKIVVLLDRVTLKVINYIDRTRWMELLELPQTTQEVTQGVTQGVSQGFNLKYKPMEALSLLYPYLELTPTYVWNQQEKKYVLCAKLDCEHCVDANSGDVIMLNSI
jgi:hypothetical protein